MVDVVGAHALLRGWMAEHDVSVKTLAARLRVSCASISNWRRGRTCPLPGQREALAEITGGRVPAEGWGS